MALQRPALLPSWIAPRAAPRAATVLPRPATVAPRPATAAPRAATVLPRPVADSEAPEEAPVPRYSPVPRDLGPSEEVLALQGALAQAQADLDALRAEQVALREACAAREPVRAALRAEVLREAEPELVRLALAVAERVLGRELRADPSLLVHWAREAVEALPSRERLTVTLSTDLARVLSEDAWSEALGDGVTISVDPSRSSGTCEVRAGASSVDAGPAGRLGAVREELGE